MRQDDLDILGLQVADAFSVVELTAIEKMLDGPTCFEPLQLAELLLFSG